MSALHSTLDAELRRQLPAAVSAFAAHLAARGGAVSVLFYGSTLRTGDLDSLLDFYVLVDDLHSWHRSRIAALANGWLPPNVSYEQVEIDGRALSAKVAVLSLAQFRRGMRDSAIDTTLWARFTQPLALAWVRDDAARSASVDAVTAAVVTAARWAALLGPESAPPNDFWTALFQRTYAAELRVERGGGRAQTLVSFDADRYAALLPQAWRAGGIDFVLRQGELQPRVSTRQKQAAENRWKLRHALGKPLNIARLAKATFTFKNGADYVAWKIERHNGMKLELTDWQRRHPLLAAPGVLWRLRRAKVLR